ncbi:hypothetical protein C8A00DRAFT_44801 [Chaetomidium leptoderma]|uniref:Uncharacterized protein n=1 Tax=Chaetomidium leptoderma TaxID=669021 RepID=A0AAN6VJN1_9PEZI|nr:hypothetical protein C8A00DRAFT_44801 [Chaetomidium leptoderma]
MMASMASAISLSNFQLITPSTVSVGCILAYNAQIPSCSIQDFVAENTCSAACARGLVRLQFSLLEICSDANVPATTVLGQILRGNLVELLCPGISSEAPTSSSSRRSSTPTPTTIIPVVRTSSRAALTFTTVRPASTTTTSTTATETDESDTDISTSTSASATTSTSSSSATPFPDRPLPTFVQSQAPTSASSSSSTTTAAPEPTSGSSSGGGSPFDVASSDAKLLLPACWRRATVVALGLGLLLLR